MRAVWLKDGKLSTSEGVACPQPGAGEALVRVQLAGICGTDLQLQRGYYPFDGVPGHEFVGRIERCDDAPHRVGERVVGEINLSCGHCRECREGKFSHCLNRKVLGLKGHDGAFAQWLVLPLANLHRVPDEVADRAAVFAEPLAAALAIPEQVSVQPGSRVLVIGAGRLGQLIARVLRLYGCELEVVVRHPRQRELLEQVSVRCVGEDSRFAPEFDLVVEATGTPGGLELARRALRPRSTLVLKSTYRGAVSMDMSPFVVDEQRIVGSRCGPFAPALRLLASGLVDPAPLVDSCYPLGDAPAAFRRASQRGVLKVLLDCSL